MATKRRKTRRILRLRTGRRCGSAILVRQIGEPSMLNALNPEIPVKRENCFADPSAQRDRSTQRSSPPHACAFCASWRQENLQAIFFQPPVERAAAEAELLGRLARIAVAAGERLLDQVGLDLLQAHVLDPGRGRAALRPSSGARMTLPWPSARRARQHG